MDKELNVLGHKLSIKKEQPQQQDAGMIDDAIKRLKEFAKGKEQLEKRIIENEQWYRLRHWEMIAQKTAGEQIESKSAWLFNSIYNKHADAMDNYPEPNILPRESGDVTEAEKLSKIIPLVLEHNGFEETYSNNWWDKLIIGSSCYSVVWDSTKENGLGDISIKTVDLLNLYWEPGVRELQDSSDLFLCALVKTDVLKGMYPSLDISDSRVIELKEYNQDDKADNTGKSVVVDWYFKTTTGDELNTKTILNYVKFTGTTVLYSSMDDPEHPEYAEVGFYEHGLYPFFIDTLFPIKNSPVGFGVLDLMKDDQAYIDKLDSIILKNAFMKGEPRYFNKPNGGINKEQFADWSIPIVEYEGQNPKEDLMQIEVQDLPVYIREHRLAKIEELKETSGNRDFSQGSSSGGVTAASAIAALQEAGNKLSRDNIKGAYRVYNGMVLMCIELIRQFYDEAREFRIVGDDGDVAFEQYSNEGIKEQVIETPVGPIYKSATFDIKIKAQKANPYSRMSQNELAKELYGAGFFSPEMADQALIALELMDFEGKQQIITKISQNSMLQKSLQLAIQFAYQATGVDISQIIMQGQMPGAATAAPGQMQSSSEQKPYAQRVQENAQVSVNKGGAQ